MRWTIRTKLTVLVLAVLLPLMAAAGVKFWLEVEQGRESAQSDMIECASAVAQLFDEILTGQIENLEALAGARAPDRIRSEDLVDAATRIKRHHGFVHRLVAVLPDGTITAASDPPGGVSAGAVCRARCAPGRAPRSPGSRRSAPAELDGRPPDGADRGADSRSRRGSSRRDGRRDRSGRALRLSRPCSADAREHPRPS